MRACVYDFEPSLLKHLPDGPSCLCSIKTQKECETALDITIVINRDNNHGDGDGEDGDGTTVMVKTEVENYQQTMKLSANASVKCQLCHIIYSWARSTYTVLEVHTSTHDQVATSRPDNYCGLPKPYRNYSSAASWQLELPPNWSYLPAPELRSSSVQVHTSTPATQLIVASEPGW